ncbi:MAG: DUF5058 family protein [Ruminiclostridium sp.]
MENYLNIANNWVFYLCAGIITLFVLLQAYLFFRHAFKEGNKQGLSKASMFRAFRTGFTTSIIPSIASVVALISMVPVLGLPIPWIRQTIMGSTAYELMSAGIGAKVMGVNNLGGTGYDSKVFATSVWVMTVGSVWAVAIIVFFLKFIKRKYSKVTDKDGNWKSVFMSAAFIGIFSVFIAGPITTGGISLITLLAGGLLMTVFAIIIVKLKQNWLKEYALTFSMLGAMAIAVIANNILFK